MTKANKNIIVIDRFSQWCFNCRFSLTTRTAKSCPNCGVRFTQATSTYTCKWMHDNIKTERSDIGFINPLNVFKNTELKI